MRIFYAYVDVDSEAGPGTKIFVHVGAPNIRDPERPIDLVLHTVIQEGLDSKETIYLEAKKLLMTILEHEVKETLVVNGDSEIAHE